MDPVGAPFLAASATFVALLILGTAILRWKYRDVREHAETASRAHPPRRPVEELYRLQVLEAARDREMREVLEGGSDERSERELSH